MTDVYDWVQQSLFPPDSAFIQIPVELPIVVGSQSPVPDERFKKIATLLEEALDGATDDEVLPPLKEALELARRA